MIGEKGKNNNDNQMIYTVRHCALRLEADINLMFNRIKLYSQKQHSETIDQFVIRLRLMANEFDWKEIDEIIRRGIFFGTNTSKTRNNG